MAGLKKALSTLNSAVQDLTSLHVQTFTGQLEITVDNNKGYKDIKATIEKEKNKANANIVLVAETLAQFDGDSYNFVKKDLDEVPPVALEVHKNAVKAGIETRLGLLGLFKDIF